MTSSKPVLKLVQKLLSNQTKNPREQNEFFTQIAAEVFFKTNKKKLLRE